MFSGNGRASNRLVVGRGTDAGSGGSMPHSSSRRGVSRRVCLFAGLGLAVALLATFAALQALPLQAQSTTVELVSNTASGSNPVISSEIVAQSFTTGPAAAGYSISEIRLRLRDVAGRNIAVKLKENNSSDQPGNLLENFAEPSPLEANTLNTFSVPDGRTLARNTTYWITINEGVPGSKIQVRGKATTTENSAYGWTIGDSRLFHNGSGWDHLG